MTPPSQPREPSRAPVLFDRDRAVRARVVAAAVAALVLIAASGCAPAPDPAGLASAASHPAAASSSPVTGGPSASPVGPDISASVAPSSSSAPTASASGSPSASPPPSARPTPFRMDVYDPVAFVTQPNLLYCVPGASEILINLVNGRALVGPSLMPEMYAYGQSLALYQNEGPGVDPVGWIGILDRWGAPGYDWHAYGALGDALHHAAARIRATGRPVGIVVGIHRMHAWVINGFSATRDPALGAFTLTSVAVTGPLWPAQQYYLDYFDMPPDTWITPAKLAPAVRPFHADVPTQWNGLYVTVEP